MTMKPQANRLVITAIVFTLFVLSACTGSRQLHHDTYPTAADTKRQGSIVTSNPYHPTRKAAQPPVRSSSSKTVNIRPLTPKSKGDTKEVTYLKPIKKLNPPPVVADKDQQANEQPTVKRIQDTPQKLPIKPYRPKSKPHFKIIYRDTEVAQKDSITEEEPIIEEIVIEEEVDIVKEELETIEEENKFVDYSKKHNLVTKWEKEFRTDKVAIGRPFNLKPFSVPIKGDNTNLNAVMCTPANGYKGYYEPEKIKKEQIVLHFTVGNIKSDIDILTHQYKGHKKWRTSVPFVVARDGTIYQLFSSNYWSHHLGKGSIAGNLASSKKSIGIEISNYGPLIKRGNNLETVYSRSKQNPKYVDVYCSLKETDKYIKLDKPFNGYQYFATFTEEQYESTVLLLRYLTEKYAIPRKFLPLSKRYKATMQTANFKGIVTHLNHRPTGKWDIGPAFDWEQIITGTTTRQYKPHQSRVYAKQK